LFDIPAGRLEIGGPADIAVFDIEHDYVIDAKDFESKGTNTPFLGETVKGDTIMTLVDGEVAWIKGGK
jgi:dihydroorotase